MMLVMTFMFTVSFDASAQTLDGKWAGSEGTYYIRQVGNQVSWYGEAADGEAWCNTAWGTISGNTITLTWADLPKCGNNLNGTLVLTLSEDKKVLTKLSATGGFGGTKFTKQ